METNERKRRKKKERKNPANRESGEEKKWLKVVADPDNGSFHVCLITKMPMKTELWKLKTTKMCFQFP